MKRFNINSEIMIMVMVYSLNIFFIFVIYYNYFCKVIEGGFGRSAARAIRRGTKEVKDTGSGVVNTVSNTGSGVVSSGTGAVSNTVGNVVTASDIVLDAAGNTIAAAGNTIDTAGNVINSQGIIIGRILRDISQIFNVDIISSLSNVYTEVKGLKTDVITTSTFLDNF